MVVPFGNVLFWTTVLLSMAVSLSKLPPYSLWEVFFTTIIEILLVPRIIVKFVASAYMYEDLAHQDGYEPALIHSPGELALLPPTRSALSFPARSPHIHRLLGGEEGDAGVYDQLE